ncbi:hypothetical protein ACIPEN_02210 [Herbaspirillum chlorophenolicum]|uniref:Uncharacterized protein n=1 Tax=Herbaspirillum chlorophenolicum TaxID=211589 RepID=A0ABW8ET52_9BURK
MKPQTTSPVLPDASREVDQHYQPANPGPAAGAHRRYDVDDLFGVFP